WLKRTDHSTFLSFSSFPRTTVRQLKKVEKAFRTLMHPRKPSTGHSLRNTLLVGECKLPQLRVSAHIQRSLLGVPVSVNTSGQYHPMRPARLSHHLHVRPFRYHGPFTAWFQNIRFWDLPVWTYELPLPDMHLSS